MGVQNGSDQSSFSGFLRVSADQFDRIVAEHEGKVYSLARCLSGRTEDAEEILSNVFVKLWQERAEIRSDGSLSTWIYRSTVQMIAERLQMRAYTVLPSAIECCSEHHDQQEIDGLSQSVARAVQILPFEYSKVFVLRDVLGLNILEISDVLSLSERGCRARLRRARLMIRRSLLRDRGNIEATHTSDIHEHTSTHSDLLV